MFDLIISRSSNSLITMATIFSFSSLDYFFLSFCCLEKKITFFHILEVLKNILRNDFKTVIMRYAYF